MIADAVHSLTDFATDVVVLIFVHLGNKPADRDHDYGHGKYETLATAIIGTSLLAVGVLIFCSGAGKTWRVIQGEMLPSPGKVALVAAQGVGLSLHREGGQAMPVRGGGGQRLASSQRCSLLGGYHDRRRWRHPPGQPLDGA